MIFLDFFFHSKYSLESHVAIEKIRWERIYFEPLSFTNVVVVYKLIFNSKIIKIIPINIKG